MLAGVYRRGVEQSRSLRRGDPHVVREKSETRQHLGGAGTGHGEQQNGRHESSEKIASEIRGAVDPVRVNNKPMHAFAPARPGLAE